MDIGLKHNSSLLSEEIVKNIKNQSQDAIDQLLEDKPLYKNLLVFNFDRTLIDDNAMSVICDLLKPSVIIPEIQKMYCVGGLIPYEQAIFHLLYDNGYKRNDITEELNKIPEVRGMSRLIKRLWHMNFDIIIISDSNSQFIETWLASRRLTDYIKCIFTNPATYDATGCLQIRPRHQNSSCSMCPNNLCKGRILEDFIDEQKSYKIFYHSVYYLGDGSNDLCPLVRLRPQDYICPRIGYVLDNDLNSIKNRPSVIRVKASILRWDNGNDLIEKIVLAVRNDELNRSINNMATSFVGSSITDVLFKHKFTALSKLKDTLKSALSTVSNIGNESNDS